MCVYVCVRVHMTFFKKMSEDNRPPAHRTKRPGQSFKEKLCISYPWITVMKWALVTQPESMKGPQRGPAIAGPLFIVLTAA